MLLYPILAPFLDVNHHMKPIHSFRTGRECVFLSPISGRALCAHILRLTSFLPSPPWQIEIAIRGNSRRSSQIVTVKSRSIVTGPSRVRPIHRMYPFILRYRSRLLPEGLCIYGRLDVTSSTCSDLQLLQIVHGSKGMPSTTAHLLASSLVVV